MTTKAERHRIRRRKKKLANPPKVDRYIQTRTNIDFDRPDFPWDHYWALDPHARDTFDLCAELDLPDRCPCCGGQARLDGHLVPMLMPD